MKKVNFFVCLCYPSEEKNYISYNKILIMQSKVVKNFGPQNYSSITSCVKISKKKTKNSIVVSYQKFLCCQIMQFGLPLKFLDYVITKNTQKLLFLIKVLNFWKISFLDICNYRILYYGRLKRCRKNFKIFHHVDCEILAFKVTKNFFLPLRKTGQ